MKIAIIVYGMYREFDIAVKSWKFLNDSDFDFYFSTWSKSIQKCESLGYDLNEDITSEMISKHIPNAVIDVVNEDNVEFDFNGLGPGLINSTKMIYHWKNGLKLIKESGKEYDLIVLMRPDSYMMLNDDGIKKLKECSLDDRIYGCNFIHITGLKHYFLVDTFFCGTFHNISKLIDTLPNKITFNIHTELAKHILSLGLYVDAVSEFNSVVVRPNVREFEKSDVLNLEVLLKCLRIWDKNNIK
jgi:hypothetical protein